MVDTAIKEFAELAIQFAALLPRKVSIIEWIISIISLCRVEARLIPSINLNSLVFIQNVPLSFKYRRFPITGVHSSPCVCSCKTCSRTCKFSHSWIEAFSVILRFYLNNQIILWFARCVTEDDSAVGVHMLPSCFVLYVSRPWADTRLYIYSMHKVPLFANVCNLHFVARTK